MITHNGGLPGFSTLVAFYPAEKLGVFISINADDKQDAEVVLSYRIAEDVFGMERVPWNDR